MMAQAGEEHQAGAVKTWLRSRPIIDPHSARRAADAEAQEGERGDLEDRRGDAQGAGTIRGVRELGRMRREQDAGGRFAQRPDGGHVVVLPVVSTAERIDAGVERDADDDDGQRWR